MNVLLDEHKSFVVELIRANVEFILVGGYAVIFHGYGRTTGDLDIWLKPANETKERLLMVLAAHGILDEDLEQLKRKDFTKSLAFHIDEPPRRIDFLTRISGLTYEEADKTKVFFFLGEYRVPVINYDHLIANKMASGRTKDKADVEELENIMKLRKKPGKD